LAESTDGIHFKKYPTPVLYPSNDSFSIYDAPGGCEDLRVVVTEDGTYVMAYTSWHYKTPRLSIAFSKDLIHWEKKGPAFLKAHEGKFGNTASKSGSILTQQVGGNFVAAKINGKYWMYWGEAGVNLAWSENLYDWYPELNAAGALHYLIMPRKGKFDSNLTECGPPDIITKEGILLLYNGADESLTYSTGWALFDKNDPKKLIARSDEPIFQPEMDWEKKVSSDTVHQAPDVVFVEGLVKDGKRYLIYYGAADCRVGVASCMLKSVAGK